MTIGGVAGIPGGIIVAVFPPEGVSLQLSPFSHRAGGSRV